MCRFQGVAIGSTVTVEDRLTCDNCGYTAPQKIEGVFLGHIYNARYGTCNHIKRETGSCPSCGMAHYEIMLVYQSNSLFEHILGSNQ